jgi:hypothetical protein
MNFVSLCHPRRSLGCLLVVSAGLLAPASSALGQLKTSAVPAHEPGTICFTHAGWCHADPAGTPGSPCVCPSPDGVIDGIRG